MPSEGELPPVDLFQALRAAQDIPPLDDLEDADPVYAAMEFSIIRPRLHLPPQDLPLLFGSEV